MKINNAQLISLLFDEPVRSLLWETKPYISRDEQTTLHLRCLRLCTLKALFQYRQKLVEKLQSLLNFEICLECEETGVDNSMILTTERLIGEDSAATETKLLSLKTLSRATGTSPTDVKKLLGVAGEVIYPMPDGSEMVSEAAFDTIVLEWAKSFKDNGSNASESVTTSNTSSKTPNSQTSRKASTKVLISELTVEDIIKIKNGEKANLPNLTKKGLSQTLNNFFEKVNMDGMGDVDTISAFIEGTTEFGQTLRKKLLTAYKKFTINPNLQEIENKLVEGAKAYLETMATDSMRATANQEE